MSALPRTLLLVGSFLAMLMIGCSGARYQESAADPEAAVERFEAELARNPGDPSVLRDLGAAYVQMRDVSQAQPYLQQAFARDSSDAKTRFYYGLVTEMTVGMEAALRYYRPYTEVPRTSPYRKMLEGRYIWISRELVQDEMRRLLQQEEVLAGGTAAPRTVAVFPLRFTSGDVRYAPLGRGLSEVMTVDLGQVQSLQVVERVRLQALLDELRLAESMALDPATTPRVGRLLGAGRLVGGNVGVLADDVLRIDVAAWPFDEEAYPSYETVSDPLARLFQLEKQLVFQMVAGMGIELTPQERERIQYVPTDNLEAFLAYSRGLEAEDAGNYQAAAQHYRDAVAADPTFQEASTRAETVEGVAVGGGTIGEALTAVATVDPPVGPSPPADLVTTRIWNMVGGGTTIDFGAPSDDPREPAAEAAGAGGSGLPDPPAPPTRGNR